MSKATHTPGPWEAHDRTRSDTGVLILNQSGAIGIARVIQQQSHLSDDLTPDMAKLDTQVCRANARLIASAPELLAILTRIIDRATAPLSDGGIDYSDVTAARAAIAKAVGEQS